MTTIAAIQMESTPDVQDNVEMACQLIKQAAYQGASLAALPENFATLGLSREQSFAMAEPFNDGKIQKQLASCAKENKIWLLGGTLPLLGATGNKFFSSCLMWNDNGELVARYNKIHMFDVMVGKEDVYRESDNVQPGNEIVLVDTPFGKIGLAVCYDLRFPELFRAFMLKGVDIIVLPSAFTIPTGKAHWEVLLRSRAIENLCYVVAPAEVGRRHDGRGTYGHSMIVGPWGDILAKVDEGNAVVMAEVDLVNMQRIRQEFPSLSHSQPFVMKELTL